MDKNQLIERILLQWIAQLKAKSSEERKTKNVRSNFEELFFAWKQVDATFDLLYETYLPRAIKAHQPSPIIVRDVYLKVKATTKYKTEKEFIESWCSDIEAKGNDAFFEYFPATTLDKDDGPKIFGSMSVNEYKQQRKHAEQYPMLDTQKLVEQWKDQQEYNIDVDSTLENILGGTKNETNT